MKLNIKATIQYHERQKISTNFAVKNKTKVFLECFWYPRSNVKLSIF